MAWASFFSTYPDPALISDILSAIKHGVDIGFQADQFTLLATNSASTKLAAVPISANLAAECSARRVLGPFSTPPVPHFRSSPLGCVPKSDGGFRSTHNLSYPHGSPRSVNSGIPDQRAHLEYETFDLAVDHILALGPGCMLSKADLRGAFRHILVRMADWHLLGFSWEGQYYVEAFLPFGLRSAPFLYNMFAELLHWGCAAIGVDRLLHYLDDFLFLEPPAAPSNALSRFEHLADFLGFSLNASKRVPPTTSLSFLGICLDTVSMSATLPPPKIDKTLLALHHLHGRSRCTQLELLKLIGLLQFTCKVLPAGRPFLRRFITAAYSVRHLSHRIYLSAALREDLGWWVYFLPQWNGILLLSWQPWVSHATISLFTDASSTTGIGVYYDGQWFNARWSDLREELPLLDQDHFDIQWGELYAVVMAAATFGHRWNNMRIRINIDNEAVSTWINGGTCRASASHLHLLRLLALLSAKHSFLLNGLWLSSSANAIADALSRFNMQDFFKLAPLASRTPTPRGILPTGTFQEMWRTLYSTVSPSLLAGRTPPAKSNLSNSATPQKG
jgi:hypothetical protein